MATLCKICMGLIESPENMTTVSPAGIALCGLFGVRPTATRQHRAPRPPGGAHEGSIKGCPGLSWTPGISGPHGELTQGRHSLSFLQLESIAAQLCPAGAKTLGSNISLPSKPCRTTAHLSNKGSFCTAYNGGAAGFPGKASAGSGRHLWLNLVDVKDADRKVLLNTPVTPSGLFGDAIEFIIEHFNF
ncbi:hypothetical protein QQF64_023954 [Cirrhinus molitorella]|uniref:Uncharacterized protein n=1 Tax=Cirrhinus molitorella TaxID=172907 RepID=A0ABR3NKQ8_9TELE